MEKKERGVPPPPPRNSSVCSFSSRGERCTEGESVRVVYFCTLLFCRSVSAEHLCMRKTSPNSMRVDEDPMLNLVLDETYVHTVLWRRIESENKPAVMGRAVPARLVTVQKRYIVSTRTKPHVDIERTLHPELRTWCGRNCAFARVRKVTAAGGIDRKRKKRRETCRFDRKKRWNSSPGPSDPEKSGVKFGDYVLVAPHTDLL